MTGRHRPEGPTGPPPQDEPSEIGDGWVILGGVLVLGVAFLILWGVVSLFGAIGDLFSSDGNDGRVVNSRNYSEEECQALRLRVLDNNNPDAASDAAEYDRNC